MNGTDSRSFRKHAFRLAPALLSGLLATAAHAAPGDPLGPALTLVANPQEFSPEQTARSAGGGFAMVYQAPVGINDGIFLQRFSSTGAAAGAAQRIDGGTGFPIGATIAMAPDGAAVVVWIEGSSVLARRYSAAGAPQGGVLTVNQPAANTGVGSPAVALDADGDFVIAWSDAIQQASGYVYIGGCGVPGLCLPLGGSRSHTDVLLRRYDASGNPSAPVNIASGETNKAAVLLFGLGTLKLVGAPTVAMDAAGDYAVAWSQAGQIGIGDEPSGGEAGTVTSIRMRRFNARGTALEAIQVVDSQIALPGPTRNYGDVGRPSLVGSATGYTLSWLYKESALHLQKFASQGTTKGKVAVVPNQAGCAVPDSYAITGNAAGDVALAWLCAGFGGVRAYRYDASGNGLGSVIDVHDGTDANADRQDAPSIANDGQGNFVVTWPEEILDADDNFVTSMEGRLYTGP